MFFQNTKLNYLITKFVYLEYLPNVTTQEFRVKTRSPKSEIRKHTYCCKELFVPRDSSKWHECRHYSECNV